MVTRRERVLLELEDAFTADVVKAAAATAALNRELGKLSRSSVQTSRDTDRIQQSVRGLGGDVDRTSGSLRAGVRDIDRYSGRLELLLRTAAILGPAIVPIGAAGIPAVAGLTAGLGALAGAFGVALLSLNGVGDALKAMDKYQLEPTKDNLREMRLELSKLGPAGEQFARFLDSIEPQLRSLQMAGRAGWFPGLQQGIENLLTMLPQVRRIVYDIGTGLGEISEDAGAALAGPKFEAFFDYLNTDARPTLVGFAQATGNVTEGVANMMVAFAPVSRGFTGGLVEMTGAFADWSAGLDDNDGFQEFLDYVRETGPQVLDLIGQLVLTLAAITEAAAPVGAVIVPALTAVANIIETIADSDLGTPILAGVAAMSALRLATQLWGKVAASSAGTFVAGQSRATASIFTTISAQQRAQMSYGQLVAAQRAQTGAALAGAGRLAAVMAGLTIASTGAGNSLGLTNTASMALMGSFAGPWGAAVGGAVGLTLDLAAANDGLEAAIRRADDAIQSMDLSAMNAELQALTDQIAEYEEKTTRSGGLFGDLKDMATGRAAAGVLAEIDEMRTGIVDDAREKQDELNESIAETAPGADAAAAAMRRLADGDYEVVTAAGATRTRIRELTDAMEEQTSAAGAAFDAVTQYSQALMDARIQAEKSNAGIDLNRKLTREQRTEVIANRTELSKLRDAWNNQGPAVANSMAKYREARRDFIETAVAMGAPIEKARQLADRMLDIPRSRVIDINLTGDREALDAIAAIKRQIESVPKEWRTRFYVTQVNSINRGFDPTTGLGRPSADGSTVPKTGRPYADRHPYLLADGEEVISNRYGQADRHRPLLKAINAGRLADGGTAGRSLDDMLAIAQIRQQIREYRRSLGADGKDRLEGLKRRIAQLELRRAEKELKLAENRERRETRAAVRGFDLTGGMTRGDVSGEFADFRRAIKEAGGEVPKNFDRLRHRAIELAGSLGKATREYDKSTEALADMRAEAADFAKSVGGIFDNDIFAKGGLANAMLQLEADTNDTNARNALLQQVAGLGIDTSSDAFKALASQADMQTLRDLDTVAEAKAFEAWFAERSSAQQQAGQWASAAAFWPAIAQQEAIVTRQEAMIDKLTAKLEGLEDKVADKVATATGLSTYAGTLQGTIAGHANQQKKNNSKARGR